MLPQLKAYDVRAFVAYKTFQAGISLEVISLSQDIPHLHTILLEGCGLGV